MFEKDQPKPIENEPCQPFTPTISFDVCINDLCDENSHETIKYEISKLLLRFNSQIKQIYRLIPSILMAPFF